MIRQATQADALACAAILNAWIDATPWMPLIHTPADVHCHYRDTVLAHRRVWAWGDPAQGYLALDESNGCITAIYITAEARGRGIGHALLGAAKATRDTLWLWTFAANTGAQRFYDRNGFHQTARTDGDNEEGLPDLRYDWTAP